MYEDNRQAYHQDLIIDPSGNLLCELCKIQIDDNNKVIEQHVQSKPHKKLYLDQVFRTHNLVYQNGCLICCMCSQNIDQKKVGEHLLSTSHSFEWEKILRIISTDGGFLILPNKNCNPTGVINCLACDQSCELQYYAIEKHVHTTKHLRARAIALQPLNAIYPVKDSDDLFCKICQVYLENYMENILDHITDDKEHSLRLGKIKGLIKGQDIDIKKFLFDPSEDKATCLKCNKEVPCNVDNLERHIKGKTHIK